MNEQHVESKFKSELLNPENRTATFEKESLFLSFWRECLNKALSGSDSAEYSSMLDKYTQKTWEAQHTYNEFQAFLKNLPFIVVIGHWVQGAISDGFGGEKHLVAMKSLLEQGIIPIHSSDGKPMTLSDIRTKGHHEIMDNIRCEQKWTWREKDEFVQSYIQFTHDLAKYTFGYIQTGYDPDRNLVSQRLVKYETFYTFIQYLSKRDSLIAQVLFFGAPSIEETLALKVSSIDTEKNCIHFSKVTEDFPKHLTQELWRYIQENPNSNELVFSNVRGELVERAHLNQSFARASEKMPLDVKITPGSLLRYNFSGKSNLFNDPFYYDEGYRNYLIRCRSAK